MLRLSFQSVICKKMGLYCFQDLQDSQNNGYERPGLNRHGITRALLRGMWLPITPRSSVDLSTTYYRPTALSSYAHNIQENNDLDTGNRFSHSFFINSLKSTKSISELGSYCWIVPSGST